MQRISSLAAALLCASALAGPALAAPAAIVIAPGCPATGCFTPPTWKGDGATDNTTPMQATLNSARTTGGRAFIPPGIYNFNSGLTLDMTTAPQLGTIIEGAGWGTQTALGAVPSGTVLYHSGSAAGITAANTSPPNQNGLIRLQDFALSGDKSTAGGNDLLKFTVMNNTEFDNLFVGYGRADGLHATKGFSSRVNGGLYFDNFHNGIEYQDLANNVVIRDARVFGNGRDFTSNGFGNIVISGGGGVSEGPHLDNVDVSFAGYQAFVCCTTLTQIVVSGGVATATVPAHGLVSNDYVAVKLSNTAGLDTHSPAQITVTDSSHFTWSTAAANGTYTTAAMFIGPYSNGLTASSTHGLLVTGFYCETPDALCAYIAANVDGFIFHGGFAFNGYLMADTATNGEIDGIAFQGQGGLWVNELNQRATINIGLHNTFTSGAVLVKSTYYMQGGVRYGPAQPTTGAWLAGEQILNSAPATGSPKGWICTSAGSPASNCASGAWASLGSL